MTCCPSRPASAAALLAPKVGDRVRAQDPIRLPGGKFQMGTRDTFFPDDGEGPPRPVRIKPFALEATAVSVAQFAAFVEETGYVTEAESFGWTYVFMGLLAEPDAHEALPGLAWWRKVDGAYWRLPEGVDSDVDARADHPVTHVSWQDARAYAAWAGGRLPTEAEWEFAALGGQTGARFPWGDQEPDDDSFQPCNIWQGRFPTRDTGADGYAGTAPAQSFAPNGFGLFNMCGNTWEWTADRFRVRSLKKTAKAARAEAQATPAYVVKGGSFLCHKSYCYRYRIAARSFNTPDSTTSHTGFRVAFDLSALR